MSKKEEIWSLKYDVRELTDFIKDINEKLSSIQEFLGIEIVYSPKTYTVKKRDKNEG